MGQLFAYCLEKGIDPAVGKTWTLHEYYLLLERAWLKSFQNVNDTLEKLKR
jgi:hypothetical protein